MLLCVPTERPPPSRFASASPAITSAPISSAQSPISSCFIRIPPDRIVSLEAIALVDRHHPCGKIEILHLGQAGLFHHARERRLVGMHADRLGEITVGVSV